MLPQLLDRKLKLTTLKYESGRLVSYSQFCNITVFIKKGTLNILICTAFKDFLTVATCLKNSQILDLAKSFKKRNRKS